MTGKWMLTATAVAAVVLAAGCGGSSTIGSTDVGDDPMVILPSLVPMSNSPIPDVPIPLGFEIGEKQTLEFGAGAARYLQHIYKGKADKWELKRFFRQQMQANRWQFVTYMLAAGEFSLEYEKDNERCRIMIADSGGLHLLHPTQIRIRLWTSGPIEIKTAMQPRPTTTAP